LIYSGFPLNPIEISYIIGIHLNYSVGFHLILNGAISSLKYHIALGFIWITQLDSI